MEPSYVFPWLLFYVLKQVSSYVSCWGERCTSFCPSQRLSISTEVRRWCLNLHFWMNFSFKRSFLFRTSKTFHKFYVMCASLPVHPSSQLVMEAPNTKIQIEGTWFLHFMQLFTSYICGWIVKIFARDIRMNRDEVTHRYVITRRFLVVTFSKRTWMLLPPLIYFSASFLLFHPSSGEKLQSFLSQTFLSTASVWHSAPRRHYCGF